MGILRAAALALSVLAAALWSLAGAATWAAFGPRAMPIESNAACAATVLAGVCWVARKMRDRDMVYLIDATVASRRAALDRTVPLRAVR